MFCSSQSCHVSYNSTQTSSSAGLPPTQKHQPSPTKHCTPQHHMSSLSHSCHVSCISTWASSRSGLCHPHINPHPQSVCTSQHHMFPSSHSCHVSCNSKQAIRRAGLLHTPHTLAHRALHIPAPHVCLNAQLPCELQQRSGQQQGRAAANTCSQSLTPTEHCTSQHHMFALPHKAAAGSHS